MSRDEMKSRDRGFSLNKNVRNLFFGDFKEKKKRFLWMGILLQLEW